MILPNATPAYDIGDQARLRQALQQADDANVKRGHDIDLVDGRLIVTTPNGSRRYLVCDDAGALSTTLVP